jgi:hypothetical protein
MRSTLPRFLLAIGVALALAAALPDRASAADVEGKITYKGKPLTGGKIGFHPARGKPVFATIQADSSYSAKKVPVGEVRVTIDTKPAKAKPAKDKPEPPPRKKVKEAPKFIPIPAKYASPKTTPLRVDIKEGRQVFDIELTD